MIIHTNSDMMQSRFRPDTYSTYVWHEMFDIGYEAEELWIDVDDIDINHDQYTQDLGEWMVDWIVDNVNDELPKWIQFVRPDEIKVWSPKYYNYWTDSMNIDVKVTKKKLYEYIEQEKEGLDKYLEKYRSCDWFISYTPSNYRELVHEEDIERVVMCVVDYLLREYEWEPMYEFDYEIIYRNLIYPDAK